MAVKVPFKVELTQLRKAFREQAKLQKKSFTEQVKQQKKAATEQTKIHKNAQKQQTKTAKLREGQYKKETRAQEKLHRKQLRDQKKLISTQERAKGKSRRKDQDYQRQQQRKGGRGGSRLAAGAGVLAGGAVGLLIGGAIKGYQNYVAMQRQLGGQIGIGGRNPYGGAMGASKGKGGNLGFSGQERAGMALPMARATGVTGSEAIRSMMVGQRAGGLDAGTVSQFFGAQRQAGTQFGGVSTKMNAQGQIQDVNQKGKGREEFKRVIAAGMASGLEKARLPEFLSGITQLAQKQGQVVAGDVNIDDLAKLSARFGQGGLQGTRGAGVMAKLSQGIMQPGGGDRGKSFMLQAMGFGRPGGGTRGFYQAEKQREKGLTGENFNAVMRENRRQFGSGEDAALNLREVAGVSLSQAEALIEISESSKSAADKIKDVDAIMEESKSLEEQSAANMKKAATELSGFAAKMDTSIRLGKVSAPAIQAIEGFQQKISKMLIEWIPKIGAAVERIAEFLKDPIPEPDIEAHKPEHKKRAKEFASLREKVMFGDPKVSKAAGKKLKELSKTSSESLYKQGKRSLAREAERAGLLPELSDELKKELGMHTLPDNRKVKEFLWKAEQVAIAAKKKGKMGIDAAKAFVRKGAAKLNDQLNASRVSSNLSLPPPDSKAPEPAPQKPQEINGKFILEKAPDARTTGSGKQGALERDNTGPVGK